jgi:hypothetical protein
LKSATSIKTSLFFYTIFFSSNSSTHLANSDREKNGLSTTLSIMGFTVGFAGSAIVSDTIICWQDNGFRAATDEEGETEAVVTEEADGDALGIDTSDANRGH